jgi:MraZ protein
VFFGVSTLNLDAKGRLAIPAKQRERIEQSGSARVWVTIDPTSSQDRCLWLYPDAEWRVISEQMARVPAAKLRMRGLRDLLFWHASEQDMDGQGRILIPAELREHAGLEKQVALAGLGNKFEIWDVAKWKARREQWLAQADLGNAELSDELAGISL